MPLRDLSKDVGPEKHKDEWIALSIDSSVVSQFTAFVAVDELHGLPVAGPMASWVSSSSM